MNRRTSWVTAYIGLGANLGEPVAQLRAALQWLAELPHTRLLAHSRLYRSRAVEVSEAQPDYYNAVAAIETRLPPHDLLAALLTLERRCARRARGQYHAPRYLDLDLLLYGDVVTHSPTLTLPHPRLAQRAFVLEPLLELAPNLTVPGLGPLALYLADVAEQRIGTVLTDEWPTLTR